MKTRHIALSFALLALVPAVNLHAARATVTPALLQAGQSAVASGNATALRDLFFTNASIYLQLAAKLAEANKAAAPAIAVAAAQAFPTQSSEIASLLAGKAPDQRAAIYTALGLPGGDAGSSSSGGFPVFPVTTIDPVIVSPSS